MDTFRRTIEQEIYVVKSLHKLLLGRPAIRDLNLLNRFDPINAFGETA